ncbi:MAG: O-methyltransferase [Lysinibacillus fusiformis]|uniref:O-methyltransferase n=1 Tax=Lysinibacillus sp. GbtcB16 TaxID=2824761 RepID=UPI001C2FF4C7|nr:O-methyltransferase [Lysinibacillus sp. GbtcB16]MCT6817307.1 O-methyltransferase [Lysinibacillus fusiformis]MCT6927692.1 O-methyltransferase [Lysinibacillus fusiformis]MCT6932326.1 O-methyltransferase [Lysinibacillus fusiformis]
MKKVNNYIDTVFAQQDPILENVIASITEQGMPAISVSPSSGKLLTMLVSITGAQNILEIGALGGYSGICLARGMKKEGTLTSLELEEKYAQLAAQNLANAGFAEQVTYLTGPALESLEKLLADGKRFDFFFIDADKENYENYLANCIKLANTGALIVMDNVLAAGSVADPEVTPKRYTAIMKKFNRLVANHQQLESILLPIGDGITVSKVKK